MRRLLYCSAGFAVGCGLCVYLLSEKTFAAALLLLAVATCLLLLAGKRWEVCRRPGIAALGICLGLSWYGCYHRFYLDFPENLEGQQQTVTIRATDYAGMSAYGSSFEGVVMMDSLPYRALIYLNDWQEIQPGMHITGTFRFHFTTQQERKQDAYYQGKGIFLVLSQKGEAEIVQDSAAWWDAPAVMRKWINHALITSFPVDTRGFARALLLGDTDGLSYQTDTDLKLSGIRHLAAVSGLHVSILFAMIAMVSGRKRWIMALLGLPSLLLFAALAGFTPSVNRACIMSGLMLLALLLDKEYDGPTALAFAVLVMLFANPMAITSVSLQLSVSSVAGIFLFSNSIRNWVEKILHYKQADPQKKRWIRFFSSSVGVSLGSCCFTIPLSAWYFGAVSLVSPLTNLLTLWVVSLIFYGIIAVCAVSALTATGAGLLAKVVSLPIRYVLMVARLIAKVPLAAVYTCSGYITAWLIAAYCLIGLFLMSRKKQPWILAACLALSLCCGLLASWMEPRLNDMRMTVLDVGQGQCIVLQSGGNTYMIDCGGDTPEKAADAGAQMLLSMGITRLDALILTHLDTDHCGGVEYLLSRVNTDLLILPQQAWDTTERLSCPVIYAGENLVLSNGKSTMTIFAAEYGTNSNETSLAILFDTEKCDILITGDRSQKGEQRLIEKENLPDVDVLIAGHHGAADAVSRELLNTVTPEIVCISAGRNNRYGHPSDTVLRRLEEYHCRVYRTDLQGTIVIRG